MIINSKSKKKKPTFHWGRGGGRGRKRECVREGKVASARVVCGDVEMLLPNIISGPLLAWLQMPCWLSWLQHLSHA